MSLDLNDKRIMVGYGRLLLKLNEHRNGLKFINKGMGSIEFTQSGLKIV
jgi:hypothetical protein